MASFTKVNVFVKDLAEGKHDFANDVLKVALFNADPTASATTYTALAAISNNELGNDGTAYPTTGKQATLGSSTQTGGTYKLVLNDVVFTAASNDLGGNGDSFRYVVLYNSTDSNKPIIGYYDYGSNVTISAGNTFTVDFDGSAGVLTLA